MLSLARRPARSLLLLALVATLITPTLPAAQDYVVPRSELHQAAAAATKARAANLEKVRAFFSSEPARKALTATRLDARQLAGAVAQLDDGELATLAARAEKAQADFAGGALSNQELTYIVIALAAAVVVIIAVVA